MESNIIYLISTITAIALLLGIAFRLNRRQEKDIFDR